MADYWAARNAYLNYVNVQFPAIVDNYNKTKRSEYAITGRGWPSWYTYNCDWNWSAAASPRFLNHRMFGKLGSIVVGGRYGGNGSFASSGLLARAFNPVESQPMCAVAAARAAVRVPGTPAGAYISSWESASEYQWNLYIDDWDAIMLPVNKAWKVRSNGQWNEVPDVGLDLYGYEESRAVDILRAVANGLGITIRGLDENAADDLLH